LISQQTQSDEFIERQIITGLIISTEYTTAIKKFWRHKYLESTTAKLISGWCFEYFEEYNRAPGRDIEGIFAYHLQKGLQKDQAEDISDILESLSDEFDRGQFNSDYLKDQTRLYFRKRAAFLLSEEIQASILSGDIDEAEACVLKHNPTQPGYTRTVRNIGSISQRFLKQI